MEADSWSKYIGGGGVCLGNLSSSLWLEHGFGGIEGDSWLGDWLGKLQRTRAIGLMGKEGKKGGREEGNVYSISTLIP